MLFQVAFFAWAEYFIRQRNRVKSIFIVIGKRKHFNNWNKGEFIAIVSLIPEII